VQGQEARIAIEGLGGLVIDARHEHKATHTGIRLSMQEIIFQLSLRVVIVGVIVGDVGGV
jgi:hypothetical protein